MPDPDWRARIRGSRYGTLIVLLVTALAVGLGVWIVNGPDEGDEEGGGAVSQVDVQGVAAAPKVGDQAPGFTASTLDGEEISLDALGGRPVWLLFVATWCSGCRAEMPDVQAAHEAAGAEGVEVVAVYVGERGSVVEPYAQRLGLTFDQIPDSDTKLAAAYGIMGVPAHYFIDADGVIQHTWVGVLSPTQIEEALAKIGG